MLRIIISIFLIDQAFAVILEDGLCPSLDSEAAIDLNRVAGIWYEYKHSKSIEVKEDRCARLIWSEPVDNTSKILFSTISTRDNINSTIVSDVRVKGNKIFLDMQLPVLGSFKRDHYLLEVDYDNYLIIIRCQELDCQHFLLAWIKIRNPNPPEEIDEMIENAFKKRHLKVPDLVPYNTKNCDEKASSEASASPLS